MISSFTLQRCVYVCFRKDLSGTSSQISKAYSLQQFKHVCKVYRPDLQFDSYRDAKDGSAPYQAAKKALYDHVKVAGIGHFVCMPQEVDQF